MTVDIPARTGRCSAARPAAGGTGSALRLAPGIYHGLRRRQGRYSFPHLVKSPTACKSKRLQSGKNHNAASGGDRLEVLQSTHRLTLSLAGPRGPHELRIVLRQQIRLGIEGVRLAIRQSHPPQTP
eukprot:scaffold8324_cov286-Pinguiococcus_pyrenoidosus.AAC.2